MVITSKIDPTYRAGCGVHGMDSPQTYLGNERYGCWHCNPAQPERTERPLPPREATVEPEWDPSGVLPEWMTE